MLKKKYRLEIEFFGFLKRPKKICFEFEQAPLIELLQMSIDLEDSAGWKKWLVDFLVKKCKSDPQIDEKTAAQLNDVQVVKIMEYIFRTYAKGFFAKQDKKQNEKKSKGVTINPPSSSTICLILEKTNESMDSLLQRTWEQVEYLIEGIVWNLNAQTKKGQQKNESNARIKQMKAELSDEDALQRAKDLEAKIKAKAESATTNK